MIFFCKKIIFQKSNFAILISIHIQPYFPSFKWFVCLFTYFSKFDSFPTQVFLFTVTQDLSMQYSHIFKTRYSLLFMYTFCVWSNIFFFFFFKSHNITLWTNNDDVNWFLDWRLKGCRFSDSLCLWCRYGDICVCKINGIIFLRKICDFMKWVFFWRIYR